MKTIENTYLTKLSSGHGHWKVTANHNGEEKTIITHDSLLIDDSFNSNEGDTSYYDSVDEARQVLINMIFDQ